jgi:hypothetical protein
VEEIHWEVVELRSRSVSLARTTSNMVISDAASSQTPLRQIPNLNSPLDASEEAQKEASPGNA